MKLTFREETSFDHVRDRLFGGDDGFRQFQDALLADPRRGVVIQGAAGARKARWSDPRRGMGKRGGIRVIYYYAEAYANVLLILAYDKNISDLTPAQKKTIAELIHIFREELEEEFP